jgi:hypothetical protein
MTETFVSIEPRLPPSIPRRPLVRLFFGDVG